MKSLPYQCNWDRTWRTHQAEKSCQDDAVEDLG
jgi:hypothetical protein